MSRGPMDLPPGAILRCEDTSKVVLRPEEPIPRWIWTERRVLYLIDSLGRYANSKEPGVTHYLDKVSDILQELDEHIEWLKLKEGR